MAWYCVFVSMYFNAMHVYFIYHDETEINKDNLLPRLNANLFNPKLSSVSKWRTQYKNTGSCVSLGNIVLKEYYFYFV